MSKLQSSTDSTETIKIPKTKPIVLVNEESSPDKILCSSWLFLTSFQFFSLFKTYFKLDNLTIEELEEALLQSEPNDWLKTVLILIISPLLSNIKKNLINTENYESYLFSLFPEFGTCFATLSILDKIKLFKKIEEANMENLNEQFLTWRNNEADEKSLRLSSLGKDSEGWSYWNFGNRLYRETPISIGKRAVKAIQENQFTFELVCSTLEEWEKLLEDLQQKKIFRSKEIVCTISKIGEDVITKIKAKQISQAKREARLLKEKEYESIPKKRSRRLEVKFEQENKRQKLQEKEMKNKEIKQMRDKMYKTTDLQLRNEIYNYVKKQWSNADDGPEEKELRQLKLAFSENATQDDKVIKMRGWLRLLRQNESTPITMVQENDRWVFGGDDKALKHNLFKIILRTYFVHQKTKMDVYKKLLFNGYSSWEEFSNDFNQLPNNTSFLQSVWNC
ncbi:unnamed protein product [Rhizopus stolonifer]